MTYQNQNDLNKPYIRKCLEDYSKLLKSQSKDFLKDSKKLPNLQERWESISIAYERANDYFERDILNNEIIKEFLK